MEDLKREIKHLENEVLQSQSQTQSLQETIQTLETHLVEQRTAFTTEKQSLEESFEHRLKEEKQKWEEEYQQQILYAPPPISTTFLSSSPFPISTSSPIFATSSPISSRPATRNLKSSPQLPEYKPRFPSRTSYGEISHLRRPSRHLTNPFESTTPIISSFEDDDEREILSPSRGGDNDSPRNTVIDAVSLSASTSTAGPSVNIIERMSAAVRRLESDLASTKEEMARSIKQRDEAREECVKLMVEVEEKRRFQNAAQQTENRYNDLENRFVLI